MSVPEPVSSRRVAPDPAIASAVGRHHTLSTAIADLVDNAVDAGARNILVRFVLHGGRATGLQIVDDGSGMDEDAIDSAMAYARRRSYGTAELGHFGIGLKAASLSQARTLVVWSRQAGRTAVGRRLRRESLDSGPLVEAFGTGDAATALDKVDAGFAMASGTLVEWQDVDAFLRSTEAMQQGVWLEDTIDRLVMHLGLVLHRILARGEVRLTIEEYEDGFPGAPRAVGPLDPFGYRGTEPGYPIGLVADVPGGSVALRAHLWPATERRSPAFHVGDNDGQGLYVYRNERLLQAGGWNGLAHRSQDLELARVELDLDAVTGAHVTFNPEKTGVVLDATLADAVLKARAGSGLSFAGFLDRARDSSREARRRRGRPIAVVPPRFGLPPSLRTAYAEATETVPGEEPFDIRWRTLPPDKVYEIDREARLVKVNARYRTAIVGGRSNRNNDAPLVKTLLHLLLANHLTSTKNGARMKRETQAWQELVLAAVLEQQAQLDGGTGLP
ncbi:Histidine kinase-, DNA gyrase B-, and HSP90-like ATPase [Promicromonospora umidemergens]|uniref:Histidine kinase/DNA gyrase B/HSP90-like ATPase n=1 Tax=Promicromonospora umidemergens TaxID=629679 RepID=A0ABP8XCH3_9MICO|nr:ATP-binding protein [Promicromonospora umidemergens]MCP2281623.1 Histidine kinase-, DNA gyrase B-, and HSP90-like ATPase [Promicromonospora umidemergens]